MTDHPTTINHAPIALVPGDRLSEITALVALMRTGAISPIHRIAAIVDQLGSAVEVLQLHSSTWQDVSARQRDLLPPIPAEALREARETVAEWFARGIDVRSVLDADYPSNLQSVFNRPPLVFVSGTWNEQRDRRSVAVVGTRQPSADGVKRARQLATELVRAGYTVISGLALGIDTAAHEAALAAGGRTAAVVGTGLSRIYPEENRELAERIIGSGGALVSQFFPEQPPTKWTFPLRNAVMSGLTLATVVIEAGQTSGARMQARLALEHGRTVFLPRSLVESHPWARKYATEGAYETRAIEAASASEIISMLEGRPLDTGTNAP